MPNITFGLNEEKTKALVMIVTYYGTTVSQLLEPYIDYLIAGNVPFGYEHLLNPELINIDEVVDEDKESEGTGDDQD